MVRTEYVDYIDVVSIFSSFAVVTVVGCDCCTDQPTSLFLSQVAGEALRAVQSINTGTPLQLRSKPLQAFTEISIRLSSLRLLCLRSAVRAVRSDGYRQT